MPKNNLCSFDEFCHTFSSWSPITNDFLQKNHFYYTQKSFLNFISTNFVWHTHTISTIFSITISVNDWWKETIQRLKKCKERDWKRWYFFILWFSSLSQSSASFPSLFHTNIPFKCFLSSFNKYSACQQEWDQAITLLKFPFFRTMHKPESKW